jgi:hypothetical protein
MKSLGLTPLEPWPGGSSRPWNARHDACGRQVSPRLGNLAAGQGPCNYCGHEAGHRKMMLDESDAEAMMRRAGLQPISPFPGVDRAWLCIHIDCGKQTSPTYLHEHQARAGRMLALRGPGPGSSVQDAGAECAGSHAKAGSRTTGTVRELEHAVALSPHVWTRSDTSIEHCLARSRNLQVLQQLIPIRRAR